MSAAVVFLLFFICLIIAIPISIALGIVSVLPGAFDPSFTASGTFVIRSMLGGIDSFPLLAVPMFVLSGMIMAKGESLRRFLTFLHFYWKINGRNAMCSNCNLLILWSNLRICTCNCSSSRKYDNSNLSSFRI